MHAMHKGDMLRHGRTGPRDLNPVAGRGYPRFVLDSASSLSASRVYVHTESMFVARIGLMLLGWLIRNGSDWQSER